MNSKLEPGIARLVDEFIAAGRPKASEQSWQARRDGYLGSASLGGEREDVGLIEQWEEGNYQVRHYSPTARDGGERSPALIYFHGGCFVSGDFETHDRQMRMLCNRANASVFLVHTRLAPEYGYPAAHDDALSAALAIQARWDKCGNSRGIVLAGDSAGGHLALVTALRLKAMGERLPLAQILIYPMLDATGTSTSYEIYGEDYLITKDALLSGFQAYIGHVSATDPEISPLYHPDLAGLPLTHIVTAEFDPLRDEGEALYRRLLAAGVETCCQRWMGVTHGFFQLAKISPAANGLLDYVATLIRRLS